MREPLTAPGPHAPLTPGRNGGEPWLTVQRVRGGDRHSVAGLATQCMNAARGVIVAGRCERTHELGALLPRLASILGWPLLADPMSGGRRGPFAIGAYDLIMDGPDAAALTPDVVLRIGDLPISKPLRSWLTSTTVDAPQVMLSPEAIWADPGSAASLVIEGEPVRILSALITAVSAAREGVADERSSLAEDGWIDRWRDAEARALADQRAVAVIQAPASAPLTESIVARTLAGTLGPADALVVGASLPIRLLERWAAPTDHPPRVLSNRGANGIDGVVSTAFGVAAAKGASGRVIGYLGDLTLLYDQGGLAGWSRLGVPAQLVVVNNDGGRIFERLPIAENAGAAFEPLIATPHGLDLAQLAGFHRLEHLQPATVGELEAALALPADRARLIEIRVGAAAGS